MTRKILILGATGMLGHVLFRKWSSHPDWQVFGTTRSLAGVEKYFNRIDQERIWDCVDSKNLDSVTHVMTRVRPSIVVNCIRFNQRGGTDNDSGEAKAVNAEFPHRLALLCQTVGARLIQLSTDRVLDGKRRQYLESDPPNATDPYGQSKHLGEVSSSPHCVTLRTSIIGHEIRGHHSLVEWFLRQNDRVEGYTRSIFSGLTSIEMAQVLANFVIPQPGLSGLFHLSTAPISKHDLLVLLASVYSKPKRITPCGRIVCDRSLISTRFQQATGYHPPNWPEMIRDMHQDFTESGFYIESGG